MSIYIRVDPDSDNDKRVISFVSASKLPFRDARTTRLDVSTLLLFFQKHLKITFYSNLGKTDFQYYPLLEYRRKSRIRTPPTLEQRPKAIMARQRMLSDSESESEPDTSAVPSDQSLEKSLRDEVAAIFKNGNMEELTVKRVRLAAEKKLGLTEGYFKQTGDWKARSEEIIKSEVVRDLPSN